MSSPPIWHQLDAQEVLRRLKADFEAGLSEAEVKQRQAEFGMNQMTARRGVPSWIKFLQQFNQPLVYILLAATAVSSALGEWVDAAVIFAVVLVNAVVGFIQESKAEKAIEALATMVRTEATVRRDGRKQRVESAELVPGDVVLLQSGDSVPADMRLIEARNLQVEEAALTGESVPSEKRAEPVPADTVLGDRKNLAFAGTLVTRGQAEGVVMATGDRTEMGRIATMLHEAVDISTPLTRKIAEFSRLLLCVILGLAALAFLIGILRGGTAAHMFMAAVALAVGAIPEGLPAAVTITLAIGVSRMARRHAIIRKMPAVETLGSTTVICSDKTGTLTENQMTVNRVWVADQMLEITGSGYEPLGEVQRDGKRIDPAGNSALRETLLAGLLCNDSQLVRKENRLQVEGDPTEAALIVSAQKGGFGQAALERLPRIGVIPFESEHMYMATLHRDADGSVIYMKGSVERLLDRCDTVLNADGAESPADGNRVTRAVEELTAQGLRVLAFARRRVSGAHAALGHDDVKGGLTLLGLQGMIDPPRSEAIMAVAKCQNAGIEVKMITGDHKGTAVAIARRLGLRGGKNEGGSLESVTGRELEMISDEELPRTAERMSVFARVAPEQKLRLVRALQSRGHVVAMTGDGVNDAPALKQADIGVAMGITGTDVSKGAADMILTDDNFASIEAAVEEGRGVFDNLTKFIVWTLPTNAGEAMILLIAIVLGMQLPAVPVQLLWVNMTTAILLGLMLVFEPKEHDLMERPPRDPKRPLLTHPLIMRTGLVSLIMLSGAYWLFHWEMNMEGETIAQARTAVVNVIVFVELAYLFSTRSLNHSLFSIGLFTNWWVIAGSAAMVAAQLLFTYLPGMNSLFHTAPIGLETWVRIAAVSGATFAAVEIEKWIRFRGDRGRHAPPE